MKYQYRVVSQREHTKKKYTLYATEKAAKRRHELLTTDEPWEVIRPDESPDDLQCCDGYQCACGGLTNKEFFAKESDQYPKLITAYIERREVGEWHDNQERKI